MAYQTRLIRLMPVGDHMPLPCVSTRLQMIDGGKRALSPAQEKSVNHLHYIIPATRSPRFHENEMQFRDPYNGQRSSHDGLNIREKVGQHDMATKS